MSIHSSREQRNREMERGRKQVRIGMAQGIVEQIDGELGVRSTLVFDHVDPRQWLVETTLPKIGSFHVESFWDFPSDELKAKIMLLGGKYGNT